MNINPDLIEKITRLVLAKLNDSPVVLPLSDEEIKQWNKISSSFHVKDAESSGLEESTRVTPLSGEELRRWEQISASFLATNDAHYVSPERSQETPQVKFFRTCNE